MIHGENITMLFIFIFIFGFLIFELKSVSENQEKKRVKLILFSQISFQLTWQCFICLNLAPHSMHGARINFKYFLM